MKHEEKGVVYIGRIEESRTLERLGIKKSNGYLLRWVQNILGVKCVASKDVMTKQIEFVVECYCLLKIWKILFKIPK